MRVNIVKSARQDQGKCGKCGALLNKGTSYIWWKFRYSGRHKRCTSSDCYPKPSELVNSPWLSSCMATQEVFESDVADAADPSALAEACNSAAESIREQGEEAQGSHDNMPEGLQEGDTGQLLQSRADACEEIAGELEQLSSDMEEGGEYDLLDPNSDDDKAAAVEEKALDRDDYEDDDEWNNAIEDAMTETNEERMERARDECNGVNWEFEQ